jgi:DNA-directed RNA polymerase I and III subunit RPAC2
MSAAPLPSSQAASDPDNAILNNFSKLGEKNKLEVVHADSSFATTFAIWEEDHTLGNLLRHMLTLDEHVTFCGYTMPHPSLSKFHIRIQTDGSKTALEALREGLSNVRQAAEYVRERFQEEVSTFKKTQNTI